MSGNWLVWIGGIALALGGAFLVKYAAEAGLFGPAFRVVAAAILALGLIGFGAYLRRSPLANAFGPVGPDIAPAILTAAGLFIGFADTYAAHAIYHFISPVTAFVLLALIAFAALFLSLRHGKPIGLLGLLGAFLVPLLVSSAAPQLVPLYVFLAVVTVTSLGVFRRQGWQGETGFVLAGASLWIVAGMLQFARALSSNAQTQWTLGLFTIFVGVIFATRWQPARQWIIPYADTKKISVGPRDAIDGLALTAGLITSILMFALLALSHFQATFVHLGLVMLALMVLRAATRAGLDSLAGIAAAELFAALALWAAFKPAGWRPDYLDWTRILVAGLGGGAVLMIALAPRRAAARLWGLTGVASLVGGYLLAFAFLGEMRASGTWGLIGAGLSLLPFAALAQLRAQGKLSGLQNIYASGFFLLIFLALCMVFASNHLTLAFAALVLLIAIFHLHVRLGSLQWLAGGIALVALSRLAFNPDLVNVEVSPPVLNWLLPVYGGAAVLFLLAHRVFARGAATSMLLNLLEAASIGLSVMLVSLNIRSFIASDHGLTGDYGYLEQSMHSIAWLGFSLGLGAVRRKTVSVVIHAARWIMFAAALANIALFQVLRSSPWFTGLDIGTTPVANVLALGLLIPGILLLVMMLFGERREEKLYPVIAGLAGLFLCILWSALELRHAFQGGNISVLRSTSAAENYGHGILFLAWGIGLYAARQVQQRAQLKIVGYVVLAFAAGWLLFNNVMSANPLLVKIAVGALPLLNLLALACLVPALLLFALMFVAEKRKDSFMALLASAGAIGLLVLWSVLELRHAFQGSTINIARGWQAAEAYSYPVLLLGWSLLIAKLSFAQARLPIRLAGWGMFGAGLVWIVLGNMLGLSPLVRSWSIGALPVLNLLALAYLVPAALLWMRVLRDADGAPKLMRWLSTGLIGALLFLWCNLTLRHHFQGEVLTLNRPYTSTEYYGYSLLWLVMCGGLFLLALRTRHKWLEYAFMGLTLATITKVFLFDMSVLGGILRAVSFMGLGGALVGLGLLYRRFMFRRDPETPPVTD